MEFTIETIICVCVCVLHFIIGFILDIITLKKCSKCNKPIEECECDTISAKALKAFNKAIKSLDGLTENEIKQLKDYITGELNGN
ncbi:hypothetical protein [Dipodfec virus UOA04_Rod_708]|nr:hypothetical protein [Dipodfec virus UOA04_Rod_708]